MRHMFAHHILKPERTPLEANIWGTPKSSGSFSTLFRSRILRALDYRDDPFEVRSQASAGRYETKKVRGISLPLGHEIAATFVEFQSGRQLYLTCGDSAQTDLPAGCVDLVATDPPFFDNVHYSELADFFYVWQRHVLGSTHDGQAESTRSLGEVQSTDAATFADRLQRVLVECYRVLRADGLLVFTYHHSRQEGWQSLLNAVVGAEFAISAALPIKSEMSVAAPKQQAKHPIDLDVVIVCRPAPRSAGSAQPVTHFGQSDDPLMIAAGQVARFSRAGREFSRNDVRVIVMAQIVRAASQTASAESAASQLASHATGVEMAIEQLYLGQGQESDRGQHAMCVP